MNINELNDYFSAHNNGVYDRKNYDAFLKHINFKFEIPAIHITGTNGKGSISNYLYHIYLAHGYHVGYYNSPYLTSVSEMISFDGNNIDNDEFINLFLEFKDEFEKYQLTSFEMQTFLAYTCFTRHKLDLVIIEVGMGGFLDATNVITPILSLISNVSLEHTYYLGRSLSEIALNKAGIIKENVPCLVGNVSENAMYAINQYAKEMNSKINTMSETINEKLIDSQMHFDYRKYKDVVINTPCFYQVSNAAFAIEACQLLNDIFPLDEQLLRKGLLTKTLSCRFEAIGKNILLDGAHNPDGSEKLVKALEHYGKKYHVIFAAFKDKNIDAMLIQLGLITNDITLTTFSHPRARGQEDYFLYLDDYKFEEDYMALIKAKADEYKDDVIVITGSLAFVGIVKEKLING